MKPLKPLYHYTSQNGLSGIIRDGKLRMTDILYLNDSSEFSHCFDLFLKNLKLDYELEQLLQRLKESPDYFIFSLSEKEDDLSQWREYCPSTGGFCIEFDYEKLSSIVEKNNKDYRLEKVRYQIKEKEETITQVSKGLHVSPDSASIEKEKLIFRMLPIAAYLKDEAFENENEWRIIRNGFGSNLEFGYKEGKSMLIPYIDSQFLDEEGFLPVTKIIIGPTPHKELSKRSVELLLTTYAKHVKKVEVKCSNIPYRAC